MHGAPPMRRCPRATGARAAAAGAPRRPCTRTVVRGEGGAVLGAGDAGARIECVRAPVTHARAHARGAFPSHLASSRLAPTALNLRSPPPPRPAEDEASAGDGFAARKARRRRLAEQAMADDMVDDEADEPVTGTFPMPS